MTTDIYLLGAGLRGSLQMTTETSQALAACRVVYVLHPDTMVAANVKSLGPDVVDLAPLYDGKDIRQDVYKEISELLVKEARKSGPVAFLVHGHPLFLVSASEYTIALAEQYGLTVTALPAVSSFDTLMCDLSIDYGYGVQVFDSTTMLDRGWMPNPHVPLLVFQLATTLNSRVVQDCPAGEVLKPLVEHLLPVYGPNHHVQVVHSAAFILEGREIVRTTLDRLADKSINLERRPTLYVPAID